MALSKRVVQGKVDLKLKVVLDRGGGLHNVASCGVGDVQAMDHMSDDSSSL